jgi:hypothetical protein
MQLVEPHQENASWVNESKALYANGTVLAQTQSKRFWHSGCYHSWRIGRSLLFDAGS